VYLLLASLDKQLRHGSHGQHALTSPLATAKVRRHPMSATPIRPSVWRARAGSCERPAIQTTCDFTVGRSGRIWHWKLLPVTATMWQLYNPRAVDAQGSRTTTVAKATGNRSHIQAGHPLSSELYTGKSRSV
jgi:hypothetical protein